jgi:hypothetical protein
MLDYMVPSRADDAAHLPGGVVVSLSGIGNQLGTMWVGSSQKFHVHELWWSRMSLMLAELVLQLAMFCFCFLKRGEKKEKNGKLAFQRVGLCGYWPTAPLPGLLFSTKS